MEKRMALQARDDANRRNALDASRERHRQDVRSRVECATLALLIADGSDGVTIETIAREAGISRRSFYRYFASPDDVLYAVLCRVMDRWADAVRARPVTESLLVAYDFGNRAVLEALGTSESFRLALTLLSRAPESLRRMAGPLQAYVAGASQDIIEARLHHHGQGTACAGALAAGHAAIVIHLVDNAAQHERALQPGEIEAAMTAFAGLIGPAGP
jgi:AcrR family transcriptional regulator